MIGMPEEIDVPILYTISHNKNGKFKEVPRAKPMRASDRPPMEPSKWVAVKRDKLSAIPSCLGLSERHSR